jgi:hypothetical protein
LPGRANLVLMEAMDEETRAYDPDLEVELELVCDDLTDPWFELGESETRLAERHAEVFEIDPVHPLRRLGTWVSQLAGFASQRA